MPAVKRFNFMCVSNFIYASMSVVAVHAWKKPEESVQRSRTQVTDDCDPPAHGAGKQTPNSSQE